MCVSDVVPGHRSELAFGKIGDVPVVVMLGRVRVTESHLMITVDSNGDPVSCL